MTTIVEMQKASPFEKLTLLLVGPEKGGKSRLAATARKPVLFLDFDHRKEAVAGLPGVYAVTSDLIDPVWPGQPTAYQKTLNILGEIEQGQILLGDQKPKTLVFDSIATFAKAASLYGLYTNPDIRRVIRVSGSELHVPLRDGWTAEMALVESVVTRALGIPGLDVICTLHETAEEAPESSDSKPSFTGKITVYPVRYKLLLKYFNEVWRVSRNSQVPTVQIIPDWKFTASTNFNVQKMDELDIEKMIAKCTGNGFVK